MAARPVGLPGTSRGVLGSSSGIKPIAGPMWLRYGLNAMLGLVAREGVTGNVVMGCSCVPGSMNCICWANMAAAAFCWIRLFLPLISSWVFRCGGGCRYLQFSRVQRPLSESKQAMTLPFSTWQLREGCANLHSASDREQVPLWNSRHTSKVSHLVSRPMVMLTAIRDAHRRCAAVGGKRTENCLMWARVTNGDSRKKKCKKIPHHRGNRSKNIFGFSSVQIGSESSWLMYFGGRLLVLPGKSGSWSLTAVRYIEGLDCEQRPALSQKRKEKKEN